MNEKEFLDNSRSQLEQQAEQLDADTIRRLRLAREDALAAARQRRPAWQQHWVPVTGLAAVVAISSLFVFRTNELLHQSGNIEDIEILTAREHLDFYEQLDFYQWLVEEVIHAG